MKIAIDCRPLRKPKLAGVANFLVFVINHLSQREDVTLYLLSNTDFSSLAYSKLRLTQRVKKIIEPLPIFPNIALLWHLLKTRGILKKIKADYYYCPVPNLPFFLPKNTKILITVYDMVYKLYAQTMSKSNWFINFLLHDRSINKADKIWCISEYTRQEVERYFPSRKSKEIVVGISIDNNIFYKKEISLTENRRISEKYKLTEKFILFVGTLEPRKNLRFLLSLMPKLAPRKFQLLIVGAKGWGPDIQKEYAQLIDSSSINFTGFVPDDELAVLYHLANVYVCPSINEGFGLPLLEAMSCGCPVVAANNSGMTEIVEEGGVLINGWDQNEWMSMILHVAQERDSYGKKAEMRASHFSWPTIIDNVLRFLKEDQTS